jgi:hypothetical protein
MRCCGPTSGPAASWGGPGRIRTRPSMHRAASAPRLLRECDDESRSIRSFPRRRSRWQPLAGLGGPPRRRRPGLQRHGVDHPRVPPGALIAGSATGHREGSCPPEPRERIGDPRTSGVAGRSRVFPTAKRFSPPEQIAKIARFGLIDRRIGGVTSRLDALCTFVTIDLQTVTSYGVCHVVITSWAEKPSSWRGFAVKFVEARHRMIFRDQ